MLFIHHAISSSAQEQAETSVFIDTASDAQQVMASSAPVCDYTYRPCYVQDPICIYSTSDRLLLRMRHPALQLNCCSRCNFCERCKKASYSRACFSTVSVLVARGSSLTAESYSHCSRSRYSRTKLPSHQRMLWGGGDCSAWDRSACCANLRAAGTVPGKSE